LSYIISSSLLQLSAKHRKSFFQFALEKGNKRLESSTKRSDITQHFRELQGDIALSRAEVDSGVLLLMLAGTDTALSLLSGLTYLLLQNRPSLERLVREVHNAFKSDSGITLKNISRLEYLGAYIGEALRIYPPITTGVRRVVPGIKNAY
jgi:cytochrome P450